MANYFKQFNDYVEKFRKVMKFLGIDVFDKDFGIQARTKLLILLVLFTHILIFFTLFVTFESSRYVEILKNCFICGAIIQVFFSGTLSALESKL
jgi:hypothetical protein